MIKLIALIILIGPACSQAEEEERSVVFQAGDTAVRVAVPRQWETHHFGVSAGKPASPIEFRFNPSGGVFRSGLMPLDAAAVTLVWFGGKGIGELRKTDNLGDDKSVTMARYLSCGGRGVHPRATYIHYWKPGPNGDAYRDTVVYVSGKNGTAKIVLHVWDESNIPNHVDAFFEYSVCAVGSALDGVVADH